MRQGFTDSTVPSHPLAKQLSCTGVHVMAHTVNMSFSQGCRLSHSSGVTRPCNAFTHIQQQPRRQVARQQVRAGLFDFLSGGGGTPSKRTQQLVDELYAKAENTKGGARASPAKREEIQELGKLFSAFCRHLLTQQCCLDSKAVKIVDGCSGGAAEQVGSSCACPESALPRRI